MDLNYEGLTAWHLIAAAPKDSMKMDYIPVFPEPRHHQRRNNDKSSRCGLVSGHDRTPFDRWMNKTDSEPTKSRQLNTCKAFDDQTTHYEGSCI